MNPWRRLPVHRLFVFTEHGLTPELVEMFMDRVAVEHGCKVILDPFVGSGTVGVEAVKRGYQFIGIDANPWALIVTRAKLTPPPSSLYNKIKALVENATSILVPSPRLSDYHPRQYLMELGAIRAAIEMLEEQWKPLALTVLGRVAEKFSLLRRTPAPEYLRKLNVNPRDSSIVRREYLNVLRKSFEDYQRVEYRGLVLGLVIADSTFWLPRRIECILTSPPFANNVDYVRHTMLQLMWAGLALDSKDLGWLRSLQIPSCEASARTWRGESNDPEIRRLAAKIGGSRARGYRRFILQYFYAIEKHLSLLAARLEGIAWYTIGDSILGGTYIPTQELVAKIAEKYGLKASIKKLKERIRAGRNLYLLILKPRT